MRIPRRDVGSFVAEVIERCTASRTKRLMRGSMYRNVYLTGDRDGAPQTFNKTQLFIDRQAAWTYSPADLRYTMEVDGEATPTEHAMGRRAVAEMRKRMRRGGVDRAASSANKWARIKGKAFVKLLWTANGFEPAVLQPEVIGVEREDLTRLEYQKAFVHTSWYTVDGFINLVANHEPKDRERLIRLAIAQAKASNLSNKPDNQMLKQVLLGGGLYPYKDGSTGSGTAAGQQAQVNWLGGPQPYLSPELSARMLQIEETWIWDDDRDDWTVFQTLANTGNEDAFIYGKDRHRNLFADAYDPKDNSLKGKKSADNPLAGETPFVEFCPRELDGYFWGMSDVQAVALLQRGINRRLDGINTILRRQEDPPRAYIGFSGVNQTVNSRLNKPGGWFSESSPTGKIQDMQPELPRGLWESLDKLIQYFDEVGGVTPTMGGEGDSGIRSGVQADTLLRTATASIKDQAIEIERSVNELGNLSLQIMRCMIPDELTGFVRASESDVESAAAEPTNVDLPPVKDLKPVKFTLMQLPSNMHPVVNCHSSSPIFRQEEEALAFELRKMGAVSPQMLVEILQPPHAQAIIDDLERKDAQQAELIQQHPELLTHMKGGKK